MYDLPPSKLREIRAQQVQNATELNLAEMWASVPEKQGATQKEEWLANIIDKADKLGIPIHYGKYQPIGSSIAREYLIILPTYEKMKAFKENPIKYFPEYLDWSKKNESTNIILMDKVVVDVTDINRYNFFSKNSQIMRQIQDMSIINQAFLNEGYQVPDHVSKYVVSSIWELDQMRANVNVPEGLRKRYADTYKQAVANYAQMYAEKYANVLTELPAKGKHQVKESYFKENHISITWDSVNEPLFDYIKQQLKSGRYPDFIYYKADSAFMKTKNLAKQFQKITKGNPNAEKQNFWSKDVGTTEFYFCFPTSQKSIYNSLVDEYNTRTYKSRIPLGELQAKTTQQLQLIYVHQYDLANWNRLCEANGVVWSLDDGTLTGQDITPDRASIEIPILFKKEDAQTINAIVNRLQREIVDYDPVSKITKMETLNRNADEARKFIKQTIEKKAQNKTEMDL